MTTERNTARRGVRSRLVLASVAGLSTLACLIAVVFSLQAPFTIAALAIIGFCSFNAMIALVMSARREETVHQLANRDDPALLISEDGVDGSVG